MSVRGHVRRMWMWLTGRTGGRADGGIAAIRRESAGVCE